MSEETYNKYLGMAYSICKSNDIKHDLVSSMWLKVHEKKNLTDRYAYVVMRNLFYDMVNDKKIVYTDELRAEEEVDDSLLERRKELNSMLDEIPYLEREVLLQHQEKSQRQLSRETGVCRDRLRMYKNNAISKLKEIAKQRGYE